MEIINAQIKSFTYRNSTEVSVKNIDLSIKEGEIVIFTGLSGSGKTTLTRILNGLAPGQYEGELEGSVKILGKEVKDYQKGELAKYIANVFQNPSDQFFSTKPEEEVAFTGENLGLSAEKLHRRVDMAFEKMDIENLKYKDLSQLSGGQKQRVAIASTLVYDTKIIFFDEPSASLDFHGIEELRKILYDLKKEGKTVIIVEHRLFFLKDLYDRLIIMKNGTIEKIFYSNQLQVEECAAYGLRTLDYKNLEIENKDILGKKVAEVKELDIHYGKNILIKNLNLNLYENEILGIVGHNGIGKTTLARTITGLRGGNIIASFGRRKKERLKNVYYMMQDVAYQIFFDTVENEVLAGKNFKNPEILEKAKKNLKLIDLWDKRLEHPQNLSGGEKQRLSLLNAFTDDKKIIILDEPTSGLDYKRMEITAKIIKQYSLGRPVLIVSHDLELITKVCNTILLINQDGESRKDILDEEELKNLKEYFSLRKEI